jgi:DNA-binding MarR family transcriptional regulator
VLRVETTINNVRDLKSPRIKDGKKVWRPMRKGVADVPRRAEVSQASNDRYLQAMAAVNTPTPLKTLTDKLSQRVNYKGKPVRGLNLLGPDDAKLLQTIGGGEYIINGFRNRDLQTHLFDNTTEDPKEQRRRSGQITRQITRKLRMLRAHGLIKKVPHTHRYHLSDKGRQVIIALQAAREADIEKLAKAA